MVVSLFLSVVAVLFSFEIWCLCVVDRVCECCCRVVHLEISNIEIKGGRFFFSGKVVSGEMRGGVVSIGVAAF